MSDLTRISACRSCGSVNLEAVMEFGPMPLADALLDGLDQAAEERYYPLTLVFCPECLLVQLVETVAPEILFGESYPYFSSFSDELVEQSRRNVEGLIARYSLDADSTVIEIASNDGYLLQWFQAQGIPVLGIDPASGPAEAALARGIPTLTAFFDTGLAAQLADEGTRADVLIGNNVLAHVPDQNALVEAMATVLAPDGAIVMEFPYVRDMVEKGAFDTAYHEHHCYFSVRSVSALFRRHGLELTRVERLGIHGGSLRGHFQRDRAPDATIAALMQEEDALGMGSVDFYRRLESDARRIRRRLTDLVDELVGGGQAVAAYGAAAKGAVMLNYCGLGTDRIPYVVDRNIHKQGRFLPGVHLPIRPPEVLEADRPDALLVLAWNFKDEIMNQQRSFLEQGGRFIVPVPDPMIVGGVTV